MSELSKLNEAKAKVAELEALVKTGQRNGSSETKVS